MILYTIVEKTISEDSETINIIKFNNLNIRNKYFESYHIPKFKSANPNFREIETTVNNTKTIINAKFIFNNIIKNLYLDEMECDDIYINYTIEGELKSL